MAKDPLRLMICRATSEQNARLLEIERALSATFERIALLAPSSAELTLCRRALETAQFHAAQAILLNEPTEGDSPGYALANGLRYHVGAGRWEPAIMHAGEAPRIPAAFALAGSKGS